MRERYLLPDAPVTTLADYVALGGGTGIETARKLGPEQTIKEVGLARVRGRGGAGFPTARKWNTVREAEGTHRFVAVNAAEGEPGTFKDRVILRTNPYQVVEGAAIAALAVDAESVHIGVKQSFETERAALTRAVAEMGDVLQGLEVVIAAGPDEYLFGEEKALLEVLEGRPPLPRLFPPYEHGLFATAPQMGWEAADPGRHRHWHESNPTVVNNVETLAHVTHVLARGAEWFRSIGTPQSPGNIVATVVGDTARAGVAEIAMATTLGSVIDEVGGGMPAGRQVKAVLGGVANAALTGRHLGVPLTYEAMAAAGSGLGAAGFIVYDDDACMVEVARLFSRFNWIESCGQCPPCKLHSGAITDLLRSIEGGLAMDRDVGEIGARLRSVTDGNRCALPVGEQTLISSLLRLFPEEFAAHLEGPCPRPRPLEFPKLVEIENGVAMYDDRYALKRADWSYSAGGGATGG
jgi:NADH-quinone oxidoreductase subunit F